MTKSNLYVYLKNKRDLYEQSVGMVLDEWRMFVPKKVEAIDDPIKKFKVMCLESFNYIKSHQDLQKLIDADPDIFVLTHEEDRFIDVNMKAVEIIKHVLTEGIEMSYFSPLDIDLVSEYLFFNYMMFLIRIYVKNEGAYLDQMYVAFMDINIRGLLTIEKQEELFND